MYVTMYTGATLMEPSTVATFLEKGQHNYKRRRRRRSLSDQIVLRQQSFMVPMAKDTAGMGGDNMTAK